MILDSMTKDEVMRSLRNDFDCEVLPYYRRNLPKIQSLIKSRSEREKRPVSLGWETYVTKNKTTFFILKKGDRNGDIPEFISEFRWKGRNCYSIFLQENSVIVYQQHCLERYAERVLKKSLESKEIFRKYLIKKQDGNFHIVLPTPTHEYSWYQVMPDVLFLGDYKVPSSNDNKNFTGIWLNTCISFAESSHTQLRIMKSLQLMAEFSKILGYNPIVRKEKYKTERKSILEDNTLKEKLGEFLEKAYMMYLLHLSFDFPFTKEFYMNEISENMEFIKDTLLKDFSITIDNLLPYDEEKGVALKGEIDFRC